MTQAPTDNPLIIPEDAHIPLPGAAWVSPTVAPDYSHLPVEMQRACRWLLWRLIPATTPGKIPKKIPYYISGKPRGATDTPADRAQLATLEEALAAKATGDYTGLGFALGPDGNGGYWQGIDYDHLSRHPEWAPLIDATPGYLETSPSGDGLHAIGYGQPFTTLPANASGVEAYTDGRYFTVTTNVVRNNGITDQAIFVQTKLASIHRRGAPAPAIRVDGDWDLGEVPDYLRNNIKNSDLWDYIANVYADDRLDETPTNIARVTSALDAISADCGNAAWSQVLWSVASLGWDCDEALARAWSQTAPHRYDDQSFDSTWRRANPGRIGIGYLFAEARRYGWIDPGPSAATLDVTTASADNPLVTTLPAGDDEAPTPLAPLDLTDLQTRQIASPSFLVDYLLPRGHVTLLAGHGGCGKSIFALTLAAHVAAGHPWSHLGVRRGGVAVFSFEDGADLLYHRLRLVINGYQLDYSRVQTHLRLFDLTEHGPLATEINEHGTRRLHKAATWTAVAAAIDGAELVIVDNASDAFDGDENSRRQVRRFIQWLRDLIKPHNGALLLLAHVDKNTAKYGGSANSYSGSTAWHNSARSRLVIANDQLAQEKLNVGRTLDTPIDLEWFNGLAMPLQAGALAARLHAQDDAAVLQAIHLALQAGRTINASLTGPNTPWHCLQHEPGLPPELKNIAGKKRLHDVINRLAAAGTIRQEYYKTQGRRPGQRWILTAPATAAIHAQ